MERSRGHGRKCRCLWKQDERWGHRKEKTVRFRKGLLKENNRTVGCRLRGESYTLPARLRGRTLLHRERGVTAWWPLRTAGGVRVKRARAALLSVSPPLAVETSVAGDSLREVIVRGLPKRALLVIKW